MSPCGRYQLRYFQYKIVIKLNGSIERYSAFDLIQKLRTQEGIFDEKQSYNLSLALIELGHTLPKDQNIYISSTYTPVSYFDYRIDGDSIQEKSTKIIIKGIFNE